MKNKLYRQLVEMLPDTDFFTISDVQRLGVLGAYKPITKMIESGEIITKTLGRVGKIIPRDDFLEFLEIFLYKRYPKMYINESYPDVHKLQICGLVCRPEE